MKFGSLRIFLYKMCSQQLEAKLLNYFQLPADPEQGQIMNAVYKTEVIKIGVYSR